MNIYKRTWLTGVITMLAAGLFFTACNKTPIGPTEPDPTVPGSYMTLAALRALYVGTDVIVPAGSKKIKAVVISNSANEAAGNFRIQDESGAGINFYAAAGSPVYAIGTVLEIDAAGVGLVAPFNGDLQLRNVPNTRVNIVPGPMTITPRVATVQEVLNNLQNWASTLVTINNVTITLGISNATGQNYSITDATGTIVSFIRHASGIVLPTGPVTSITGYISIFQPGTNPPVAQLGIRSANDVVTGSPTNPVVTTTAVTAITNTTATSGGNVTAQGASAVTARGVVWGTSANPTVALATKTSDGTGTGSFTSSITGLTAGTTYYVRAYATNSSGTAYGNELTFNTTGGSGGSGISLSNSPFTINFNNIGSGLPQGVTVVTGASATALGTSATFISSPQTSLWKATSAGFKNFASATGLTMGADSAGQVNHANRALGVRQTSATGFDPGAAFVFQLNNTTGISNLTMEFLLQSLDTSGVVTRTTTWAVDYGIGDNPTSFTAVTTTGTMTTGNKVFSSNLITVNFPAALNNVSQKVWIRIVALTPTTGTNNRPSSAIDDVKFSWN